MTMINPAAVSSEQAFDSLAFRSVFRAHPGGVAVVTLQGPDGPTGFTATSVVSVSADPAIVLFTIMEASSNWPALKDAESVVIHFLSSDHANISKQFSTSGIDRFEHLDWTPLSGGEPLISAVDTWMRCKILSREQAGGSFIVLAEPVEGQANEARDPLVYFDRRYHRLSEENTIQT